MLSFYCSFMGRSVIDFPVSSIASVLQNLDNFHLWNKFMTVSTSSLLVKENTLIIIILTGIETSTPVVRI